MLKTQLRLLNMGSFNGFIRARLALFAAFFCASVSTLFSALFRFFGRTASRIRANGDSERMNSDCVRLNPADYSEKEAEASELELDVIEIEAAEGEDDFVVKEVTQDFFFKLPFQTSQENYESFGSESLPSTSTNKYGFSFGKDFNHHLNEPEDISSIVKELFVENGFLSQEEFEQQNSEAEPIQEKQQENLTDGANEEEAVSAKGKEVDAFIDSDTDSDSATSSPEVSSPFVASTSDGFLTEKDFEDASTDIDEEKMATTGEDSTLHDINLRNVGTGYEPDDFEDDVGDSMEELRRLEIPVSETIISTKEEDSSNAKQSKHEQTSENSQDSCVPDSEDSNRLERLWEHQELIEQLQMELKRVKAIGLPTILEEDECPKTMMMEDLKTWKIDESFQHQDKMGELHKFCRSYKERMRKFDILNYQKMYAIGFLQSKDPFQSMSSQYKPPTSALTSLFSSKFLSGKRKKSGSDPMESFIRELHSDLETVYVGQMCLSWEILRWQYEKALQLWESDPYMIRRYNEVAGEFQRFQVLLQRFIENEVFEGPRVQNYVKNRCVLRNLLQVPVIREDGVKDGNAIRKGKDEYTITSDMLVEIMEESIRIFCQFVRADNDVHNVTQKARKETQIQPQDPTQLELLTEIRTSLQKKEKKLRGILRSGNYILRKLKEEEEEEEEGSWEEVLCFFAQVDMKMVARVLNMSTVTVEQLRWCHSKLSNVTFVGRKLHLQPSFLLFPC